MRSRNLWDFALDKKNKTKPKGFAKRYGGMGITSQPPHYA